MQHNSNCLLSLGADLTHKPQRRPRPPGPTLQAQLAVHKAESEATVARNLAFIDRILADKDALSAKCVQLGQEAAAARADCTAQLEALKEGLARELRRQKVGGGRGRRQARPGSCADRRWVEGGPGARRGQAVGRRVYWGGQGGWGAEESEGFGACGGRADTGS